MEILDTVAILADQPALPVVRGQVGTIVEILDEQTVEVEFSDEQGRTYAQGPVKLADLIRLIHHRVAAA